MREFHEVLSSPDAMAMAGVGEHLRHMVAQSHDAAWFTIQGVGSPTTVGTGSKAGDPLGDVLFT
eukprot:7428377-Alexandrium_andersonii.AAC.1